MSEWLAIYLFGCLAALIMFGIDAAFTNFVMWLSKGNVLQKNLKKLDAPDKQTFWSKAGVFLTLLVMSALLSWIQVLISIGSIIWKLFSIVRELFTSVPEEIKRLRFPLYNNPAMTREAVWAYAEALRIKAGEGEPNFSDLRNSLEMVTENNPSFDCVRALENLQGLKVANAELLANMIANFTESGIDAVK